MREIVRSHVIICKQIQNVATDSFSVYPFIVYRAHWESLFSHFLLEYWIILS